MKQIRHLMMIAICMLGVAVWAQQAQPTPTQSDDQQHKGAGHGHGMGQGQGHGHGMMNADEHVQMLSEKLNLTDDQKAKIKPIVEQHLKDRDAIMKDTSLTPEQKHAKMQKSMDAAHAQINPILNDDQKKQFAQMMQDMHGEGMHQHKGDHHHGQAKKDDTTPK